MILLRVIKTLQSLPEYSKLSLFPQLRKELKVRLKGLTIRLLLHVSQEH